ncbi:MAG: hypothetical protein IKE24_08185 [Clostridia bacterium]|nr:hypothetical protein [Clostridia bacterium]
MASEYLRWKYRDVQPDEKPTYTRTQKAKNWWHYHWAWVLLGALLLIAGGDILLNAMGFGVTQPDYQAAYIASAPLEEEAITALEAALASLGEDCNGDGRVVFRIQSYVDMASSGETEAAQYAAAAQVRLMADMESCESYFFLCADPEKVQENYQILARADGELAGLGEAPRVIAWESLPLAREETPALQALSGLWLARRGFWQERTCAYRAQCDALWEKLTEGVAP